MIVERKSVWDFGWFQIAMLGDNLFIIDN